jgi:hypothetical protein
MKKIIHKMIKFYNNWIKNKIIKNSEDESLYDSSSVK